MVVALVALFFSIGGLGYAKKVVTLIDGHQIKKGSIEANRLSKAAQAELKGKAGPQGLQGLQGVQGAKGDQGPQGTQGPQGVPGTARAFGRVAADGTLSRSFNAAVRHPTPASGVYCISAPGVNASMTTPVATADIVGNGTAAAKPDTNAAGCNAGEFEVQTTNLILCNGNTQVCAAASDQPFVFAIP